MTEEAERYLRLALRLGRHDETTIDAYFGPSELAAEAAEGPPADLAVLIAEAESLLSELAQGWHRVTALRTYAGVLAGESWSYAHEVQACYGVRPQTPTPQSVVTEGIARLAPLILLDGEGGQAFADVVREAGVELDLALTLAIERATGPREWAQVNAALMLHETGASESEVRDYLIRWGMLIPELADHVLRFMTDPSSRSYVIAYPAGLDLCRGYAAGQPERFAQLLTRQLRVSDLQATR